MRRIAIAAPLLLSLVLASPLTAQRYRARGYRSSRSWLEECRNGDWGGSRERFCEERTVGWSSRSGATLTVDATPNGGVSVSGWDEDSVHVVVRIQAQADDEDEARALAEQIRVTSSGGRLSADGPASRRGRSWSVSFVIQAPRRMNLDLTAENGPLSAEGISGTIRMEADNGPLELRDLGGDVRARAHNGPLTIELTGSRWEGVGLDAETTNGPLSLSIPEDFNAQLETGTTNGPMDIGFPITIQGRFGFRGGRPITTTLGSGGPTVRAITTNGPLTIRRN